MNNIEYSPPNFEGLVLGCIDASKQASKVERSLSLRRFLQVNTRWKALAEIYKMHSFAPFFNLKISAKNRQHFFANEK